MLEEVLGFIFRSVVMFLLRVVLFPVALLLCLPFILGVLAMLAIRGQARFSHVVADDYSSIDVSWWN